jgi:hypothetical protein
MQYDQLHSDRNIRAKWNSVKDQMDADDAAGELWC